MQSMPRTRTFLAVIAVAAALTGANAHVAHGVDCRTTKGAGHPWAWRQVDGKRCWYKGKAGIDKKRLRWKAATVGARPAKPLMIEPSGDDELLHSVWPPLDSFDNRFKGERK